MGWCSGSYLANDVWNMVKEYLPNKKKKEIAKKIVDIFSDQDADCWGNPEGVEGIAYPEWFKEEN